MTDEFKFQDVELSIIIPIMNERESLGELHRQLTDVLTGLKKSYEIIFVDDGSNDGSGAVCRELAESDEHVSLVELRRNFGKSIALSIGFQAAMGDIVITIDGDLQDDPQEIGRFISALEDGADLVSGWKKDRHDPITKTFPSRCINALTSRMTGIPIHDFNCGFKAYRREVVKGLDLYGELHRYIPVLAHSKGFRVQEIHVQHHPHRFGTSKYGFRRFLRGAFDLLTVLFLSTYQRRPLHLFGPLGLLIGGLGFAINIYLSILWILGQGPIGNRPLLTLGTLLIILGIQVLFFGLLAEMITASTHRRSDVMGLVRKVYHRYSEEVPIKTSGTAGRQHAKK